MPDFPAMPRILEGKTALITGAGQGNGRAMALGLAAAGARIIAADVNAVTAAETAEACGQGCGSLQLDISDRAATVAAAAQVEQQFGPISTLINNAGILLRGSVDADEEAEAWDRTIRVNVSGSYYMTRAFLGQLRATRGTVINIGSIQSFVATPNSAAYTASKGAIIQLTKALAAELAPDGIRVNGIAPGVMRTPMTVETLANDKARTGLLHHVPLKRVGEPEELAGPAVFLASDLASYITGVMLPVDGGYLSV